MPNSACLYGPPFSISGDAYFMGTSVLFQVLFEYTEDEQGVLAYEWYIDQVIVVDHNTSQFAHDVACGSHSIGVRILSPEGWSGIKSLEFTTCRAIRSISIFGPDLVNIGATANYSVLQIFSDETALDVTDQYLFTSTPGGSFKDNVFTINDSNDSYHTAIITAQTAGSMPLSKQVVLNIGVFMISGPDSVNEGKQADYLLLQLLSDGSSIDHTADYSFSSEQGGAFSSHNTFTADLDNDSHSEVTITAQRSGGTSFTKDITIINTSYIISGPASIDEGQTARYLVLLLRSDGSSTDHTSEFAFSCTEGGSFQDHNEFKANMDDEAHSSVTIYAQKEGFLPLSKAVTVKDTPVSISGPGNVDERTTAVYLVLAQLSDGSTVDHTPEYIFWSSPIGSFVNNVFTPGNVTGFTLVTIYAQKGTATPLSKLIVVNNILQAGTLIVDLFDDTSLDVIGFIDNADVADSHVAAYTGHNIVPSSATAAQAFILASDVVNMEPSRLKWRFQFNIAKLMIDYPDIQNFIFYIKGRSGAARKIDGNYSVRNDSGVMLLSNSAGSYLPSVSGGSNTVPVTDFNADVPGGADDSHNEGSLTVMARFNFNVQTKVLSKT